MTKFQKYVILMSSAFDKMFGRRGYYDAETRNLVKEALK